MYGVVERRTQEAGHDEGSEDAEDEHALVGKKPGHGSLVDVGDVEGGSELDDDDVAAGGRSAAINVDEGGEGGVGSYVGKKGVYSDVGFD